MTTTSHRSARLIGPLGAALALAACSHGSGGGVPQAVSAAPVSATPDSVIALLDAGDEAGARRQLAQIEARSPGDSAARVLSESIDKDPVELLGPKYFTYTTQRGDTMIALAERFLGNRLKFYQLARYNGVKVPSALAAGTELHIPGTPPRAAAPARPAPHLPAPARPSHVKAPPPAPVPAAAPATPAANPALANQLRGAGLAALNGGNVARAVALLGRASTLDPANPLIAREYARAQRIAHTVQTHQ